MGTSFNIDLRVPVAPLHLDPGAHVTFTGALHSSFDGAEIDAATTTWPGSAPGGASVDALGLVDFDAGGLRVVARDPTTHVVDAVATGDVGRACAAAHVASPASSFARGPKRRAGSSRSRSGFVRWSGVFVSRARRSPRSKRCTRGLTYP